ncbi:ribulose-5-phosphate 4-epimerase/fuculose-1-phosphate aldolase [Pseudonocardia eucalypti]|uniref:class II aldolase/adducin family protein n=1 Tax=Pseudonocardia eucalypti TaxID=648755 RepID=UPI00161056BD|nr:ribulose-5-phosphate 4-epimerase/fuculose-1-phosphate aldolase [Pseudonocardia eucalypti]
MTITPSQLGGEPELLDDPEPESVRERTVEQEREHRKIQLATAFRIFARYGFEEGVAGHITARDPEWPDHLWVNPYGVHFARVKVSDLLLLNGEGKVVGGSRRTNKTAFAIHAAIHDARPDVVAVAHAHTLNGRAWASLSRPLDPIIQESCAFWNDHVVFDDYRGLVLDKAEGEAIAQAMGGTRAAILRHHGLLTVGRTVEEAVWWFITMDRAAHMQLMAEAAGTPRIMSTEEATLAHRQFGNANQARHSFNLLADLVREEQPDVVE